MGFASKLQRLEALASPAPPRPGDAARPIAPLPRDLDGRLEVLRSRIQAVIERSAVVRPAPAPVVPVDDVDLPFVVQETPLGPLNVRTLRLLPSHRMGHAPVLAARHASADLLGLLALDPSLAACDPRGALYLDTETTGLQRGAGTLAFLVGLAFWEEPRGDRDSGSALVVEQLLLKRPGEEGPLLERIAARMRDASMVVTFNGKAFDLPLLRTRYAMARMPAPAEPPHLDLVHVARRIHKARGGSFRLTAIEERVLGFARVDDVAGSDVSACYLHFLRTGDAHGLVRVVDHNAWDVVAMASLVGHYGEPLETTTLAPVDLVGVGKTLFRAGDRARGMGVVERAVSGGAGDAALFARASMAKRTGDKAGALRDLEAMASRREGGDPGAVPRAFDAQVCLELAKLLEHHAKDPARALEIVGRGTGERPEQLQRRVARLQRKLVRAR